MYAVSHDDLAIPNTIVTALAVDEEGLLWFSCQHFSPRYFREERSFPVRLHFYRKGIPYHLEVSGKATLESDPDSLFQQDETGAQRGMMVFKMRMSTVECTEFTERKSRGRVHQALEQGYHWMLKHLAIQPSKPSLPNWHTLNQTS
jgi:hypothetical protein